ncbi:N-acetyl-gamma-glutamyl-phosphate reductase [Gilvimarinus sp. F26214L]|uniref:N-acetyl-gamma-glutamyl-phosphate reductase n=1 Tax=Gilvimarinus sp. DZF01 TaxID=3461371 RepID=UPI004045FCF3
MIKVGIVGATGYTGVELLRLLAHHPDVEIVCVTSRAEAGRPVSDLYPSLRGYIDLKFVEPDPQQLQSCDAVFFATPHGVAQGMLGQLLGAGLDSGPRVIDISADFRLRDQALWESWYNQAHACPEFIEHAVYGLPELNRAAIREARLVACPGCYPTVIQLGFLPLVEAGVVDAEHLIANAATGASGAGRSAKVDFSFSEVNDSFKAYGIGGHRHQPEIEQTLAQVARAGVKPSVTFIPHLAPMTRGIHATLYAPLLDSDCDLQSLFEERYRGEPFVDVMPAGSTPPTGSVKSSNMCRLSVFKPAKKDTVVVLGVIDNLTKGSSGQAIQCFNLMFGLEERTGIDQLAVMP